MAEPKKLSETSVSVADVVVRDRLRPVSEAGVAALTASVAELGVMKDPIHVRKVKHRSGELVLMAGAHRLEMAQRLGWLTIPATVWDCTDDWAQFMEIDDNLAGAELTVLDTAVFMVARKRVYERRHPETKADAFKGNRHTGKLANDIVSFTSATAEKLGISRRHVERMVSAGETLDATAVARLRGAERKITLADLQVISKIGDSEERHDVVSRLAEGRSKSAAKARRAWADRDKSQGVTPSLTDARYVKLLAHWVQCSTGVKRMFIEEYQRELRDLLARFGDDA